MTTIDLTALVRPLTALPKETEWVEFKHNYYDPQEIGEKISAISNSAALHRKPRGSIVWGIEDSSHKVLGTDFRPRQQKVQGQELENWLVTQLDPRIDVRIHEGELDGKRVVVFEVQPATNRPVRFKDAEHIRVGSYTKKLRDHPEKERALWRLFDEAPFEAGTAVADVSSDDVLGLIEYPAYFRLMRQPLPDNRATILQRLESERIINRLSGGRYSITNVGAILFATKLHYFDRVARKALRVIIYQGENRVETVKEQTTGAMGYATGFEGAIRYINDQLPQNEHIGQALRQEIRLYPEIAIRELVANALIHQDFCISGAGPMVEIFSDRIEITNPGSPLIPVLRFIDEPPRSRNEALGALLRRMAICEERGSGIDKVVFHVEAFQLPAPDFRVTHGSTVAVLFGPRDFGQMDREERIRACYQHACLLYVSGKRMTNASLRSRLGIKESNYPMASRIIRDALDAQLLKPHGDGSGSKKDSSYVPFWA